MLRVVSNLWLSLNFVIMSQKSTRKTRLSQQNLEQSFSQSQQLTQNVNELVQRCVRFFVLNMSTGVPIQRTKIIQQVFKEKPGKQYDVVLKKTAQILENIYGLKLKVLQSDSTVKKYILTSSLKHPELITKSEDDKFKNMLTSLILAHIFMNKGCCTEKSIWDFLSELNIKPENCINGGQMKQFVTKTLVKEQLLNADVKNSDDDSNKTRYSWGSVAETSVSKKNILDFYSQMYDGINMKGFSQYEEAMNQTNECISQE